MPRPRTEAGGATPGDPDRLGEGACESGASVRTQVFVSYSHQDKDLVGRLLVHLKFLERSGIAEVWSDHKIQPGGVWREEIREALRVTRVAILLVSVDFLNSDFITTEELPPLLKAAEEEGAHIIPVIVGPCKERFKRTPELARFQAKNSPESPVSGMNFNDQETLWDELGGLVADLLEGAAGKARD